MAGRLKAVKVRREKTKVDRQNSEKLESEVTMVEFERRKRKTCRFCENKVDQIDYKDERLLRKFITDRGKIVPRRISGNCAWHQRRLTVAVKRARHLALLPFTGEVYR